MKFTTLLFSLLLISSNLTLNAWPCKDGSGTVINQKRKVSDFSKVIVKGTGDLYVKQGDKLECEIVIDDNLASFIETYITGETLVIKPKKDICPTKYEIHVTAPDIEALGLKGSGNIYSKGKIKSEQLKVRIDGSGDAEMDIDVEDLSLLINGSGEMKFRGTAEKVHSEINGSGDMKLLDCASERVWVEINGSGDAEIYALEEMDVLIRGSGDVVYKGSPKELETKIYGSGELKKIKGNGKLENK